MSVFAKIVFENKINVNDDKNDCIYNTSLRDIYRMELQSVESSSDLYAQVNVKPTFSTYQFY